MLASIQKIQSLEQIEGADLIEKAYVLGWMCVVQKEQKFTIGDKCIYIEIDTIVPGSFVGKEEPNILVRSLKLRGVLSQGLVLPISQFPQCENLPIGTDVSELLGVTHFEKNTEGKEPNYKDTFPRFISKTDEPMVQSVPQMIEELKGKPYYITIKLDGCSTTFYNLDNNYGVCSRKVELFESESCPFWAVSRKYNIDKKLPNGIAIQGETCGPNISKNKMQLKDYILRIFNVFDIKSGKKLNLSELKSFAYQYVIPMVNIVEEGNSFEYNLEELKQLATSASLNLRKVEGIVVRSQDQKISFKVLNDEYLLKYKE